MCFTRNWTIKITCYVKFKYFYANKYNFNNYKNSYIDIKQIIGYKLNLN